MPMPPRACLRAIRFALHLAYGVLLAATFPLLPQRRQKNILRSWSTALLSILNVRTSIAGNIPLQELRSGLIVANHISWLDVIVLNAVLPLRFVAKSEVRGWPVIGWLCARAHTLFIARHRRSDTAHTNLKMAEALQQGECLALFPEGTTTDGSRVKHFHSSLLQSAIDAHCNIYPVTIRYHDRAGNINTNAAYIDDMTFAGSLWKIFCSRDLHVRLTCTAVLNTQAANRRTLAQAAQYHIAQALPSASPSKEMPATVSRDIGGDESQSHFQSPYSLLLYAPLKPLAHKAPRLFN